MKKFYTLLAAAAVTVSSVSAQKVAPVNVFNDKPVKMENKALLPTKKASLNAVKAAPTVQDMTGKYILSGTLNDAGFVSEFEITDQNNTEGTVTIKGLVFSDTDDITAYGIVAQDGSAWGFRIPGNGQVTLFSQNNSDYKLYLFDAEGKREDGSTGPTLYIDDIDFIYNAESEVFEMNINLPTIGFAWVNSSMRGNWIIAPEVLVPNGTLTATEYISETETEAASYSVYGKYESRFGKESLIISNIGGMGTALTLQIADGKGTALNAQADEIPVSQNPDGTYKYAPFYYMNVDDESGYKVVADCYNNADGKTEVIFGETMLAYNDEYGWAMRLDNAKIVFNKSFLSAINNVSADFDENAPVEYFNLQGVRVENPANGLYIKRQGNKVAKVIL